MTDVAYQCHNCGSVHEVESIRQNLILDLRAAARYELSGQHRILNPRARFLRWRMTRSLAQVLWPGYSQDPRLARGRRLAPGPTAPLSNHPVPCRVAPGGSDACTGNPASASSGGRLAGVSVESSTSGPLKTMISRSEPASPHAADDRHLGQPRPDLPRGRERSRG
jgi:hypothetical protein